MGDRQGGLGLNVLWCRSKSTFRLFFFVLFSTLKQLRVARKSGDVGEYGRTQTSSHDQPVCFDGWLRRRSGEAAPTSGPLAVRGECDRCGIHVVFTQCPLRVRDYVSPPAVTELSTRSNSSPVLIIGSILSPASRPCAREANMS